MRRTSCRCRELRRDSSIRAAPPSREDAAADRRASRASGADVSGELSSQRRPQVPYSLVTAIDLQVDRAVGHRAAAGGSPPIVINDWTARDLGVTVGDPLTLDYYVWEDPGVLRTRSARLRRRRRSCRSPAPPPIAISRRSIRGSPTAETLGDWDPPFPIDLRRVRPRRRSSTGSSTARRRRRSSRSRTGSGCGGRASAIARRSRVPAAAGQSRSPRRARSLRGASASRLDPLAFGFAVQRRAGGRTGRVAAARPTSASTSPTSASSSWSRRCCWRRCSSGSASSSARAKSACCARSASRRRASAGCSPPKGCCWRSIGSAARHRRRASGTARR